MARGKVSRGTRAPLRKMVWSRLNTGGTVVAGVTPVPTRINLLTAFEAAYGANLIGATAIRVRGTAAAVPVTGAFNNSLRMAVCVEPATVTSPPVFEDGPFGSPFKDWMLFESFINLNDPADLDEVANRVIDVKSMRKMEEVNDQLTLYVQGPEQVAADTWNWAIDWSVLLKLP